MHHTHQYLLSTYYCKKSTDSWNAASRLPIFLPFSVKAFSLRTRIKSLWTCCDMDAWLRQNGISPPLTTSAVDFPRHISIPLLFVFVLTVGGSGNFPPKCILFSVVNKIKTRVNIGSLLEMFAGYYNQYSQLLFGCYIFVRYCIVLLFEVTSTFG